jgi:hypothetical protein
MSQRALFHGSAAVALQVPEQRAGARMSSYQTYLHLIERVDGWDFADLGDLLLEIRRDPDLDDREREQLLEEVYRLIWKRAKPLLRR